MSVPEDQSTTRQTGAKGPQESEPAREREPWASADWDADRDWEMTTAHGMAFADLRADFDEACERSRSHVEASPSLDVLASGGDSTNRVSLRWILIHMIEEYARHCGHADILRESIDGRIGD